MKDVISVDSNSKSEDTLPENSIHEPLSDNPSPSKGLLKATEPPQDSPLGQVTSLDEILWYPGLGQEKEYAAMRVRVEEWHKQQQIKLIERIEGEVIGDDEEPNEHFPTYLGHKDDALAKKFDEVVIRDRLKAKQREAINKVKESL